MHDLLSSYGRQSAPVAERVFEFLQHEPRLTWISLLWADFPHSDIGLAGGTLRDVLLGRLPQDIDLVISGLDEAKLHRWLIAHGAVERGENAFAHFKFVPHGQGGSWPIEIALPTLMHDPLFSPCDFTVNAMVWMVRAGKLIDPSHGLDDLHDGLLRTTGETAECFSTDPLRILRAIRLSSMLSFGIEGKTWEAMTKLVPLLNKTELNDAGEYVYAVPRKAIGRELTLGLMHHPAHTLKLWDLSGALDLLLPELADLKEQLDRYGENSWTKTLRTIDALWRPEFLAGHELERPAMETTLAAVFSMADHPAKLARALGGKFHLSGDNAMWLLENLRILETTDPAAMRPSHFEKTFCSERGQQLLLLIHAFEYATGTHSHSRERLHIAKRLADDHCTRKRAYGGHIPKLVSGSDVLALGLSSGPHVRDLLAQVRDAQLQHVVHTKDEALIMLRELMRTL